MHELVLRVLKQYGLPTVFALALLAGGFWLVRQTILDNNSLRSGEIASLKVTVHELTAEVIDMERRLDKIAENQSVTQAKLDSLMQLQIITRRRVDNIGMTTTGDAMNSIRNPQ